MISPPQGTASTSAEACGLALYSLAAFAISVSTIGAKAAANRGAAVAAVILYRCVIASVLAVGACAASGTHPLGHRRQMLLVRGGVGCGGILGQVYAAAFLPVAIVSVFAISIQPLAAAIAAMALLGEPPARAVLFAMPLSVVGIVLMLEPWKLAQPYPLDALAAAVISPCCIGCGAAVVRKLASANFAAPSDAAGPARVESPQVVLLYLQLFAGGAALLAGLREPTSLTIGWPAALPVLAAGLGGYLYQLFITMALARARAAGAATMESLRVCFTALADWLLFGIAMDGLNVAGAVLVVASAAAIVAFR